jgi:hypothetical protein
MADEHLERLESLKAFIQAIGEGSPVPPVNSDDLRRLHDMCEYVAKRHPDSARAISVAFIASVCGPGANLPAVWFRYTRLMALAKQGRLAEWQHGSVLDDVVYQVAATISMNGFQFDREDFVQRLRYERVA